MLFPLAFLFSQLGSSAESTDDGGFCAVGVCIPRVMDGRTHLEAGAGRCFCCSNRRHAAEKPLATAPFPAVGSSSLTYRGGWAWCRKRSALFFSQTNSASGRETDVRFQQALHHTTSRNKQGVRVSTQTVLTPGRTSYGKRRTNRAIIVSGWYVCSRFCYFWFLFCYRYRRSKWA